MTTRCTLQWSTRPLRRMNRSFGHYQLWRERGGQFEIRRYPQGTGRYIVMRRVPLVPPVPFTRTEPFVPAGNFPTLKRARNFCAKLT